MFKLNIISSKAFLDHLNNFESQWSFVYPLYAVYLWSSLVYIFDTVFHAMSSYSVGTDCFYLCPLFSTMIAVCLMFDIRMEENTDESKEGRKGT